MTRLSAVADALPTGDAAPAWHFTLPGWLIWTGGRLLSGLTAILFISAVVFGATQILPSDPARVILGPDAPQASIDTMRHQLGLDRPVAEQYGVWIAKSLKGDLGRSLDSDVPVSQIVSGRLANSLTLMLIVLLVSVPLSFWAGIALALRRDRWIDRTAMSGLIFLKAVPNFIVGIGLIFLLATSVFRILPAVSLLEPGLPAIAQPRYLVLPVLTLILMSFPFLLRLVRAAAIETLEAEYVAAARLRGVPEKRIIWRHVIPNALVPAVQGIALMARILLGGVLIVEVVFSFPGIGTAMNAAIEMRDLPVVQAIALILALAVILINLAADIATVLLSPRLRTARKPRIRPGTRARIRQSAGL
ncbi:hypothetical protein L288_20240 [Sphingobium quisquiliarum P25]|uniref:ABC transmembrane type-1 domain-containing protein n=1 Tax=Sphingobium quisquiliarum P25 TaxID=1329909 RepID=T0G4T3_9SPHN|nr:ABC transporter permease subunit [Sphingobium quisquiliarum]EQA98680.1 hypothetical protein L288_20240 [Sphingobium quisquiliarum P25]